MNTLPRSALFAGILVGGRGLRMGGRDKARLRLPRDDDAAGHGTPPTFVERLAHLLEPLVSAVRLAGRDDQRFPELPQCPLVPDPYPGCGPLGGLAALLREPPAPWCFLVACDLPLLEAEVLALLSAATHPDDRLVIPGRSGTLEPTCALYHAELAEPVERAVAAGQLAMQRFVRQVPHRVVPLPPSLYRSLSNINAPADLALLQPE